MTNLDYPRRGPASAMTMGDEAAGRRRPFDVVPFLTQVFSIVRRRKWFIMAAISGSLIIGLLLTLFATPQFTAASTLEIRRDASNFINVQGAEPERQPNAVDMEFYQTQYGLLRSRALAERVAASLNFQDDPYFFQLMDNGRAGEWFENGRVRPGASTRDERVREAGDALLENLYVVPERLSRLVAIRFTSPEPELSQRVVNAWTENFIQSNLERRFEATSYARRFLEERLAQLRLRIDESERRLVAYAAREGIVNVPTGAGGGPGGGSAEHALVADDLGNLNRALAQATADRMQAESRLNASPGTVNEALNNMAITGLRQRRAEAAAEYSRLMVQFDPEYPAAQALQTQIEQLDRSIAREEARVQDTLRQTYRASLAREQSLRGRVDQLKGDVLDLRRRSIQYNIYQRDADTNRELYDALLQRYKEIGVAGGVGLNNISVVDSANRPDRPTSPNIPVNMLVALLMGLAVATVGAFAMEQIDQGIADPSEVEDFLHVPLLGTIPKSEAEVPTDDLLDMKSALSEAYLSLNTNLGFSTDHGVPKSMAVTSSRPAEGKTTTSFALATALARLKRKVLLIDADMRSPSVHSFFELDNGRGLSNFLSGGENVDELIRSTPLPNLFAMTAGPQPPSSAELLSGDRLALLLSELLTRFDHVVLDAPPVMGLADAPLISSRVEGVVFVVESHGTQRGMAKIALDRLRATNSQVLGAVLTKFDARRAHYGYGYDYGYGYGSRAPDTVA